MSDIKETPDFSKAKTPSYPNEEERINDIRRRLYLTSMQKSWELVNELTRQIESLGLSESDKERLFKTTQGIQEALRLPIIDGIVHGPPTDEVEKSPPLPNISMSVPEKSSQQAEIVINKPTLPSQKNEEDKPRKLKNDIIANHEEPPWLIEAFRTRSADKIIEIYLEMIRDENKPKEDRLMLAASVDVIRHVQSHLEEYPKVHQADEARKKF